MKKKFVFRGIEMCIRDRLGQDQINRYNMYSTASLTCNVAPGSSTGQAIQEVEALFKEQDVYKRQVLSLFLSWQETITIISNSKVKFVFIVFII